jgi:putative membrane protein
VDRKFLSEAYEHANEELSIGNLAQRNGSSDQVKKIGDQIATDESKALSKLRDIADKDGLVLPQALSKSDESTVQWLTKLSGKTFDNAFLAHVRTHDSAALTAFKSEAKSGQFDDLKKYADAEVPTIEGQLDRIKSGVAELQKENASTNKGPAKSPNPSK